MHLLQYKIPSPHSYKGSFVLVEDLSEWQIHNDNFQQKGKILSFNNDIRISLARSLSKESGHRARSIMVFSNLKHAFPNKWELLRNNHIVQQSPSDDSIAFGTACTNHSCIMKNVSK